MPETQTAEASEAKAEAPDRIGDHIEEVSAGLFGEKLSDPMLTLKCRYLYVSAKIEAKQRQNEDPSQRLLDKHDELEQRLKAKGVTPSFLLKTAKK
jgi:hypothetical protein